MCVSENNCVQIYFSIREANCKILLGFHLHIMTLGLRCHQMFSLFEKNQKLLFVMAFRFAHFHVARMTCCLLKPMFLLLLFIHLNDTNNFMKHASIIQNISIPRRADVIDLSYAYDRNNAEWEIKKNRYYLRATQT